MKTLLACAAFLTLSASFCEAQEYDLAFHRMTKAGGKFNATIKFHKEDDRQVGIQGTQQPDVKVKMDVELSGLSEELAVTPDGNSLDSKLTVATCTCLINDKETPLFKANDVIEIKEETPKQFLINGSPAAGLPLSMLTQMFPPRAGQAADAEDRIYAPGHKVKVGDTWPLNPAYALEDLAKKGLTLPKDSITGSAKLESANPKFGIPCLQISSEMKMAATNVPLPGAPPEIKGRKFEMTVKTGGDFPVDKNLERLGQSVEMRVETEGSGTIQRSGGGAEVNFHSVIIQKLQAELKPVP